MVLKDDCLRDNWIDVEDEEDDDDISGGWEEDDTDDFRVAVAGEEGGRNGMDLLDARAVLRAWLAITSLLVIGVWTLSFVVVFVLERAFSTKGVDVDAMGVVV